MILDARYLHDVLHDILDGVDLEKVVHALHDAGEALKTHTGIDIAALEAGIVIVAVVIKLSETRFQNSTYLSQSQPTPQVGEPQPYFSPRSK